MLIFSKPASKNLLSVTLLVIRIGIAFTFFWAGFGKVSDPVSFGMMLQQMASISPDLSVNLAMLIGTLELVSGGLLLSGFLIRPVAIFQIMILVGAMVLFGFDFTSGPAIWKDPTLLGVSIGLLLYGSGRFGVDYVIGKRINY